MLKALCLLAVLALPLSAQSDSAQARPSLAPIPEPHRHPVLDRSEWLTPRTGIAGVVIGAIAGWTQTNPRPRTGAVVGAGYGLFAGAVGGMAFGFRAPSHDGDRDSRAREIGRYMGYGAQAGLGSGLIVAMQRETNGLGYILNGYEQTLSVVGGLLIGAVMGFVSYFIQH